MSRQIAMEPGLKHKLDYDDLAHTPNDRLIYELAEGELHVTPSPNPRHQWISKTLQRQLEAYFEGRGIGRVYNPPIDVVLTKHDVFVPDLVVVTDRGIVTERAVEGIAAPANGMSISLACAAARRSSTLTSRG